MDNKPRNVFADLPDDIRQKIADAIGLAPEDWTEEIVYEALVAKFGLLTRKALLAIDVREFDRLYTYPGSKHTNWQLERDRLLFLQTAVRAGIPWPVVVLRTIKFFGPLLRPPFQPVCEPSIPDVYQSLAYDVSRSSPEEWARKANAGWERHRNQYLSLIRLRITELEASGQLVIFNRSRTTRETRRKEQIIDEKTANEMAAKHFILGRSWVDLTEEYPPTIGNKGTPLQKAKQRKKRPNQIRMRVAPLLNHLGLPKKRK